MPDSQVTVAEHTEGHNPALRHHFADEQQQKNAASLGMWLFLVTEIMFFGGMFCAYLVYRLAHFNAFAAGSQQLNVWLGSRQYRCSARKFGHRRPRRESRSKLEAASN